VLVLADFNIGDSVERGFTVFFDWLPNLIGALVVLVIGYFVAKLVANLVGRVLHRAGLDRTVQRGQVGSWVSRVTHSPSHLLARVTFWALMFGVFALTASVLGIELLESFVATVWAYIPNVIAALLIFLVAGAISAGVAGLVTRVMGDTGLGKVIATAAPILVMTIATFMILDQLMIAETIVTITYAGLIGAIALGSALAFGLGGREVARQMLQGAYASAQANKEQWRSDLDSGVSRARGEASRMKDEMSSSPADAHRDPVRAAPRAEEFPHGEYTTHPAGGATAGPAGTEPAFEPATERTRRGDDVA
jgi:hypothetical protein